jgi:hypothetical protein
MLTTWVLKVKEQRKYQTLSEFSGHWIEAVAFCYTNREKTQWNSCRVVRREPDCSALHIWTEGHTGPLSEDKHTHI